ncbi:ankyrin repeat-containing domain protein [Russula dissimulans]|nr:ankyrin repeat-containing domain protein [Russula dissimulans]
MKQLFDPRKPHFSAWTWIYDVDRGLFRGSIHELPKLHSLPNATSLYYAVLCGFSQLTDYLISTHGEDVNARCGHGATPLHAAASMGHIESTRVLLDHGADVDSTNPIEEAPLAAAYENGHLDVMRLLIDHGANVDVPYSSGLLSHSASFRGELDVIRLLVRHNADANAVSSCDNSTPLHCASSAGHAKVAEVLLEHGADINARDAYNETPLSQASSNGHLEVVRLLLRHGADVRIRRNTGLTIL